MTIRTNLRRHRDKLEAWALHALFVLATLAIVMGVVQIYVSQKLHTEMVAIRMEHKEDEALRKERLRTWEAFRSQLTDTMLLREGEIRLIKQRIEQIEAQHRLDYLQGQAFRDRANQR